jgi:hypothetical protein
MYKIPQLQLYSIYTIITLFIPSLDGQEYSYLNVLIKSLINSSLSFVASILFIAVAFYLLLVAIKGNYTYGFKTACFTFYPIA